ncbi:hypothetical protein ABK040_011444 [Willaertia magna]
MSNQKRKNNNKQHRNYYGCYSNNKQGDHQANYERSNSYYNSSVSNNNNSAEPNYLKYNLNYAQKNLAIAPRLRRKQQYERYQWPNEEENPHCEQILHYNDPVIENEEFTKTNRLLKETDPSDSYRSRKTELKSTLHWGQRKLLMSEIEFLTEFGFPNATVVYAGAAPDELAAKYSNKDVLFISDIRTAEPGHMSEEEVEKCVKWDNEAQMNWHKLIKPRKSMLKFRLPYRSDLVPFVEYLKGEIYLPVWGPQTTSETRLVCDKDCELITYDTQKYQDQMFYFNTRTRTHYYPHNVKADGIDHCYDCRSEVYILANYLKKYKALKIGQKQEFLNLFIALMSSKISRECSSKGVTLATYSKEPITTKRAKDLHKVYETGKIQTGYYKKRKHEENDN